MFRAVIVLVLLLSIGAFADEVTFQTNQTLGCFGSSCTPVGTASVTDLSFAGVAYGPQNTAGGVLNITLGSFTLTDTSDKTLNTPFEAVIRFVLPAGINGGQAATYDAVVTGSVSGNWLYNQGNATINFANGWTTYSFANGSFDLMLNDVNLSAGQLFGYGSDTENLTAQVRNAYVNAGGPPPPPPGQTPEPGTIVLMGSGLMTMAGAVRRKLRR
jgi:hypothetical protein